MFITAILSEGGSYVNNMFLSSSTVLIIPNNPYNREIRVFLSMDEHFDEHMEPDEEEYGLMKKNGLCNGGILLSSNSQP